MAEGFRCPFQPQHLVSTGGKRRGRVFVSLCPGLKAQRGWGNTGFLHSSSLCPNTQQRPTLPRCGLLMLVIMVVTGRDFQAEGHIVSGKSSGLESKILGLLSLRRMTLVELLNEALCHYRKENTQWLRQHGPLSHFPVSLFLSSGGSFGT